MGKAWTDEERRARSIQFATEPLCPSCGETDPNMFYIHKKNGRRTNAYCAKCHKQRCKERYSAKTLVERRASRAIMYGLSPQEYLDLVEEFSDKCGICGEPSQTRRSLHVDHDHKTGKARGLLCHGCNTGIGALKDAIDMLKKAIEYLERYS